MRLQEVRRRTAIILRFETRAARRGGRSAAIGDVHAAAFVCRVDRHLAALYFAAAKLSLLVMMSGTTLDEETLAGAKAVGFDSCIDKVSAVAELQKLLKPINA